MSIADRNKINVKDKALVGQRVIKVTNDGNTVYLPVGLSSTDPTGGVDVSIITTTADQVLSSAQYMTKDGVLENGTIETLSITQCTPDADGVIIPAKGKYCAQDITVEGDSNLVSGNIKKGVTIFGVSGSMESGDKFEMLGFYDSPDRYMSEKAKLNGQAGNLVDFRFRDELVMTINTVSEAETIYPAGVESIFGENNYITLSNISNIKPENLKKGVQVLDVVGTYEGTAGADLSKVDYISEYELVEGRRVYGSNGLVTGALKSYVGDYLVVNDHAMYGVSYYSSSDSYTGTEQLGFTLPRGIYGSEDSRFYVKVANLKPENIKSGVVIGDNFLTGTYEGAGADFSAASVFDSTAVLKGNKAYNGNGDLVDGSIDLTNLEPYSIKRGVTINGVAGKYTSVSANAATAADILAPKIAFVNGNKLTGTMPTSTPSMEGNTVTVPKGYVSSDQQFTVESSGGVDFYECAGVSSGGSGGIKITGSDGWDGIYLLTDPSATGDARIFQSAEGKSIQYEDMGILGYRWNIIGNDYCSSSDDPNATIETICSEFEFDSGNPTVEPYSSGGGSSWSGYKMVWSEGAAGNDIIVTGATEYLNGVYTKYGNANGWLKQDPNEIEGTGIAIEYTTENPYGDITTGWIMYHNGNGDSYYGNTTAGAGATIEEICNGPWVSDWAGSGTIPTFTPSGSPAGWAKTDELVEGLEIKGYTPEIGKIYAVDSTIAVAGMYPAEIATGGGESGSTVPYIEVSGAGSADLNGRYYMKDANATEGSRAFALEDGSAEIFFDNSQQLTDSIGWMIAKPGNGMAAYVASGNAGMSAEEICSATWTVSYGGTAPAPTLTYNSGSGSSDSGSNDGGNTGISKPTPGATNVVMLMGITDYNEYDSSYLAPTGWRPIDNWTNNPLTGTNRVWVTSVTSYRQIKWDSSLSKWVVWDDDWGDYRYIGDNSTDPWDCAWTAVEDSDRTVFCNAFEV